MAGVEGKTIVITGASSGVGAAAARELHRQGAVVVPVGRSRSKTEEIGAELGVKTYTVDFENFQDVRELADQLLATLPKIHVLANNAGGIPSNRQPTVDGNEPIFQVNTLSPFLLTQLLTQRLEESQGRVVMTSSRSHKGAKLVLDQLDKTGNLRPHAVYARSKLASALLLREYARRHPDVMVADFHPGIINSDFGRYLGPVASVLKLIFNPILATPRQGAETLIYLSGTDENIAGKYFVKKREATASLLLKDTKLAAELWDECNRRIGFNA